MPPNNYYQPGAVPPPMPQQAPPDQQPLPGSGNGSSTKWIISIVLLTLLLIVALGFGYWAFSERNDYKNNVDAKIATAKGEQKKQTTDELNKVHAEQDKSPVKTYVGPASYGSIKFNYPKTYSGYVTGDNSSTPLDAYFHPDTVPSLMAAPGSTTRAAIALHVQVRNQPYDDAIIQYQSLVSAGAVTGSPFALKQVPKQIGMKFVGTLQNQLNGTEIVLPLRDKTVVITSETDTWLPDFNTYILETMTFEP